jgi:hypothetical protein
MQAQVDAAEADAARSMAAYKDAYAATRRAEQMLERIRVHNELVLG